MYNLLFLLPFAVISVKFSECKCIGIDIYFESSNIKCRTVPAGEILVAEGDLVQFAVQAPVKLRAFWCTDVSGNKTYYRSDIAKSDDGGYSWITKENPVQRSMFGPWTCLFHIEKLDGQTIQAPITSSGDIVQGSCPLRFAANATLRFIGLDPERLTPNPDSSTDFVYKYKIGEKLSIFCQESGADGGTRVPNTLFYDSSNESHRLYSLATHNVMLIEAHNNSFFECNTTSAGIQRIRLKLAFNAPNNRTRTPRVLTGPPAAKLSVSGSPQLLHWTQKKLQKNEIVLRTHNYNFADGEIATLKCTLDNPTDHEENYILTFYLDKNITMQSIAATNSTIRARYIEDTFKLNKDNKMIQCLAEFKGSSYRPLLKSQIHLHYIPPKPKSFLSMAGSPELQLVKMFSETQIFNYSFTDGQKLSLNCTLNNAEINKYRLSFSTEYDSTKPNGIRKSELSKVATSISATFKLNKEMKMIKCVAENIYGKGTSLITNIVYLHYTPPKPTNKPPELLVQPTSKRMELSITGLPKTTVCNNTSFFNTTCTYNYKDDELRRTLHLECVLSGGIKAAQDLKYQIDFGGQSKNVTLGSHIPVVHDITLTKQNEPITCTARELEKSHTKPFVNVTYLNYIPPEEPSTSRPALAETTPSPASESSSTPSPNSSPSSDTWTVSEIFKELWVKLTIVVCVVLITLIVAVRCTMVLCRRKKPPPSESNYANLSSGNNYPTMPVAAPRTLHKPTVGSKPTVGLKPIGTQNKQVLLENTYSEPKDSQDMSEALYADPHRFVGESDTYAEPYVKSDTYAEPYKSEPAYAELNNAKELYARPIPKAQRKPKVKDESNYSNVFLSDYGNTK